MRDPTLGPYAFTEPTFKHHVSGALVRCLAFTLRILPAFLAYLLADLLVPILVIYTRLHERRVSKLGRGLVRNQRIVFREGWTPRRSRRLLWAWARHMTHMAVDFFRLPKLTSERFTQRVDGADLGVLRDLHAEGQGVICVSGHLGVFELSRAVPSLAGLPCLVVSRPADNPIIRRLLRRIRTCGGQCIIYKFGSVWPLCKALTRGELVGLSADENDRHNPVFVPFLGTLAATNFTSALLQRRTRAPIAVVSCHRVGRGRYRYHVWKVIRYEENHDLEAVTRQISAELSRAILTYPEQWLWGSRRFQSRPQGEVPGPDGLPPIAHDPTVS